jgi:hypothetical protein
MPNIKGTGFFEGHEAVQPKGRIMFCCDMCELKAKCLSSSNDEMLDACMAIAGGYGYWIKSAPEQNGQACEWKDDGECYLTGCGPAHYFAAGNVNENRYKFCPYCGKPIKEATG